MSDARARELRELGATAARLYRDVCTDEALADAERDGWSAPVWKAQSDSGFDTVDVPERFGGGGGSFAEALVVAREAGRYRAPVPVAEPGMLAGWLAARAGIALPGGLVGFTAPQSDDPLVLDGEGALSGTVAGVPWGRRAAWIVALARSSEGRPYAVVCGGPASVGAPAALVRAEANLAGEPRDTIRLTGRPHLCAALPDDVTALDVLARGALVRAAMTSGALAALAELTLRFADVREQFGRPIRRFQAVQEHLVVVHQQAALADAAVDAAIAAVDDGGSAAFEAPAAKAIAGRAALLASKAAHQVHGAMGMTQEYPLHHLTRRLWSWPAEYGSTRFWVEELGRRIARAGAERLYPTIAGGSSALDGRPAETVR